MAKKKVKQSFDRTILLLQGGGALGAYQVGVFKGLCEHGFAPDWIVATSIGALNSAIIAGNAPEKRSKKLIEFWESISLKFPTPPDTMNNILLERWQHYLSALYAEYFGIPGFFKPRDISPWFGFQSSADKLSYYDTEDLRNTLLRFIDFDRLNNGKMRLSLGAVRIATGKLVYFDNHHTEITPEHVMACCALPPGFPAVWVDDELFWDGGVHSNTQINLLFTDDQPIRSLCFMVHLFDSYGTRPTNMDDVLKRLKDINYSSHHRQFIQTYRNIHNLRHAIRVISENLPEKKRKDPELKKLIDLGRTGIIHVVRFHYKAKLSDLSTKDFEFSLPSTMDHIRCGYDDVCKTVHKPPWEAPCPPDIGLIIYEVSENPVNEDNPFS